MKILAFSLNRQDVAANIEEGTLTVLNHLIKIWLYPKSCDKLKWRKEIAAAFWCVKRFKGNHKLPSSEFILDNSWYVHASLFDHYVELIREDYPSSDIDASNLKIQAFKYFEWLAGELSKSPQTSNKRIYNKLEELGF